MRPTTLTPAGTSRGLHSAWIAILALSPLAYFGATLLEDRLPHDRKFTSIAREQAIDSAATFAQILGIDARSWTPATATQARSTVAALFRRVRPPALERVFAPATIDVTLTAPDGRWITVNVTPDGRAIGFVEKKPAGRTLVEESAARAVAEDLWRRQLGPGNPFLLENPTTRNVGKEAWEREFVWEAKIPGLPESKVKFHVDVAGIQPVSQSATLQLDPASKRLIGSTSTWDLIVGIGTALCFTGLGIYAIMRYVQRSIEREISHRRTLLLAAAFVASGLCALLVNAGSASSVLNGDQVTGVARVAALTLGLGFLGILLGVAYGAGEGELREAYPGKLVSVDAFLSGKWLSANCARSILAGGAFAGWLLLILNTLLLLARGTPATDYAGLAGNALQRSPLVQALSDLFPDVTSMAAFGLMLPLAFLRSRIRRHRLVVALLLPLSALVASTVTPSGRAWQINVTLIVIWTAAACAPFFFGDLLAAVSSVTALVFVGTLLRKSVVSDQWHTIAYSHVLPAGVVFLLVQLYCAWRGRIYDERQVRPLYARHLAERLALTAEIGAARLAQVRLLPGDAPRIAGLSIAGSCIPAREVGGDFFDYYVLDEHRLGIFLAEGGSRELGSAMAIALAKGFLMYTARIDLSPVEVLRRLRATLGTVLRGEDAPMAVLYAVVDGRNGSVRYARAGSSPRVLINGHALAEEVAGGEIRHGAATLAPNDALFFFTDGWAAQIAENARRVPDAFLRDLTRKLPAAAAGALHKAALDAAMRRRRDAPLDDVTTVVVRREEVAAAAIGGIA
ncbi:membrane hypothetical protein [Candidatus Sulfopaludibacter sp. SbA4]|nr:membrane hypothetical protein [Candidatus Sulfopaludibacter sp. SbA4]